MRQEGPLVEDQGCHCVGQEALGVRQQVRQALLPLVGQEERQALEGLPQPQEEGEHEGQGPHRVAQDGQGFAQVAQVPQVPQVGQEVAQVGQEGQVGQEVVQGFAQVNSAQVR